LLAAPDRSGPSARDGATHARTGQWRSDASSPIIIARDGEIIDGNHRLRAIIELLREEEDEDDNHDLWRELNEREPE
jgi:hypothetical protein